MSSRVAPPASPNRLKILEGVNSKATAAANSGRASIWNLLGRMPDCPRRAGQQRGHDAYGFLYGWLTQSPDELGHAMGNDDSYYEARPTALLSKATLGMSTSPRR